MSGRSLRQRQLEVMLYQLDTGREDDVVFNPEKITALPWPCLTIQA
jgi:hypothetical protein